MAMDNGVGMDCGNGGWATWKKAKRRNIWTTVCNRISKNKKFKNFEEHKPLSSETMLFWPFVVFYAHTQL